MSNTRDTGFLRNAIQVTDQGVTFVSGSTTLMSISSSGAVTTTGVISGSNALSASFSLNSALLNGIGSVGFATTGALLEVSSSQQQISSSQQQISASLLNVVANYATTGSNSFRANQSITGSLVVSSTITAQTLVVQTVTSSIVYSSGSNLFGSALGDTQTFTGSLQVTGSMSVTGSAAFSSDVILPYSKALAFNSISNQYITADSSNLYLGAANLARLTISSSGLVGIGATDPVKTLDVRGTLAISNNASSYWYMDRSDDDGRFKILTDGNSEKFSIATTGVAIFSGSVGIGTTSPQASLDIAGKANTTALTIGASNGYEIFITGSDSANIYHASPNQAIYLNTNGGPLHLGTSAASTLLTISGSSVGIGTASPSSKLEVYGGDLKISKDYSFGWRYSDVNSNMYNYIYNSYDDTTIGLAYRSGGWTSDQTVTSHNFQTYTSSTWVSRLVILQNGNVGIGVTNPDYELDINSASTYKALMLRANAVGSRFDTALEFNAINVRTGPYARIGLQISSATSGDESGGLTFWTIANGSFSEKMAITSGGNLGIGTTNPSSIFQVASAQSLASIRSTTTTNYAEVQIENTTNYLQVGVEGATGNRMGGTIAYNSYLGSYANYGMTFHTNNLNRMTITNAGNVGIGTTSPTAVLQVRGPNAVGTFFDAQNVGAGGAVFSRINASSSPYNQYLFNNGNVGIDRTPLAKLAVLGGAVQIMGDYANWQTIIKSAGAGGTFNGALTITIPEMSNANIDGYGGYSCEVYVAGYQGMYCHAWFSGYVNGGIVVSETTILRSSGGWSISQSSYGTYNQGFTFTIDYPSGIIHPAARIIFNKGGSPNSTEYPANSITAVFS